MMDTLLAQAKHLAAMPLRRRRHLLRALWQAALIMNRPAGFGFREIAMASLRLGRREATGIDREIAFHDRLTILEWAALLRRDRAGLEDDVKAIAVQGGPLLERVAASGKPVILAPLHMGNYVIALAFLMKTYFSGRPLLVLRARDDDDDDTSVMRRVGEIGTELRFLKASDKGDYIEAVRFVRRGAVVVYMVDLPGGYGSPVDVHLLGARRKLALGIDALARLADATIVPLSTTASLSGDEIHVGQPFEVAGSDAAERARVAGLIAGHVERSILRAPAQWHFWARLDEFAGEDDAEELAA